MIGRERNAAIAYRGDDPVGLETDPSALTATTDEWAEKGYRVEVMSHDQAVDEFWAWRRRRGHAATRTDR